MSENIPDKQWAQVYEKTGGPIEYKEVPVPKPGPDEILVNVKYCGVCHSDLLFFQGAFHVSPKLPLIGGHEAAGIVVARGDQVKEFEVGDRAGIKWINGTCLSCEFCQQADEMLCSKSQYTGFTVDGGFRQYALAKATQAAHLHPDIPLDKVAPILCAGVTSYTALKESGTRPGQTVAIAGAAGGLGSFAVQYAKALGLDVIAIDSGDEKKQLCEKLGARIFIDFKTSEDLVADVKAATEDGLGPHAALIVATSEKSFEQASQYVRPKGTLVAVGLPPQGVMHIPIASTVMYKHTVKGSYVGNRRDMAEALEFFRKGLIDCPVTVVGLSELKKVYDLMSEHKVAGRYVVDTSK